MKIKNVSLLALTLTLSLFALVAQPSFAIPTDPTDPSTTPPAAPSGPSAPTAPVTSGNAYFSLADTGTTQSVSLTDTNGGIVEVTLPVDPFTSWCYIQNVPAASGLITFNYTPTIYGFAQDPKDSTKVIPTENSDWIFVTQVVGPVTLSFYARTYDGQLFPAPYTQVYTFTINVTQ